MGEMILRGMEEGVEGEISQYEEVIQEMKKLLDNLGKRVSYSDLEGTNWKKLDERRARISMSLLGGYGMSSEQRGRFEELKDYYNKDVCGRIVH